MTALPLTNVRTVRMWARGIAQLKWKHSSGTSATVRAPWVPEEWDPACSDGEENKDINNQYRVILKGSHIFVHAIGSRF